MISTLLIWVAIGMLQILIVILPTWDIIPDVFTQWLSQAVAFCWGINWLIPIDQLFIALTVSFAIDLILVVWWVARWVIGWIPFIKHH